MGYPIKRNLEFHSNERIYKVWQWKPGGVAQDFTGWTKSSKVREDPNNKASAELDDWAEFITLNVDEDGNAADGYIILDVPVATVAAYAWTKGVGFYDIVLTSPAPDSDPLTWCKGSIKIKAGMA